MRVTWIVRAAFALLFAAACGGMSARPFGSDASPSLPDAGPDAGDGGAEASGGDAGLVDAMVIVSPPPPDAGPPPVVSCGGALMDAGSDAGAADGQAPDSGADCPLPAPSCVGSYWQVYYSGGSCQAGFCAFTQHVVGCNAPCSNGHCGLIPVTE